MTARELERLMADRGLISAETTPLPFGVGGRPWFVSVVMGGAGWLASIFALGFVLLLFQPDGPAGAAVLGAIMLGAGFGLYRADRDDAFFGQLALALSLAGQLALMWAVGDATESATAVAGFTAVLSTVLVFGVPDHFAKSLSTFFACLAWALFIRLGWWGDGFFEQGRLEVSLGPALVGWFVIWIPIGIGVHHLVEREVDWMAGGRRDVARAALTGLLTALSVGTWASEPFAAFPWGAPPAEVPVNWLVIWPLLAVGSALFAGFCAYRLRHRALVGVAIAGALMHVVQFYYLLGVSLVTKSWIMLTLGGALLFAARTLGGRAGSAPEGRSVA